MVVQAHGIRFKRRAAAERIPPSQQQAPPLHRLRGGRPRPRGLVRHPKEVVREHERDQVGKGPNSSMGLEVPTRSSDMAAMFQAQVQRSEYF